MKSIVMSWSPDPAKLSSFSRIARHSFPSTPSSWAINQDTLRRWERSAREQTFMCSQVAGLSRCLTKVQDSMMAQLITLRFDKGKGKASGRSQHAIDELEYLGTFNGSITKAMARTMQDLSEGIFINMTHYICSVCSLTNYWRRQRKRPHKRRKDILVVPHKKTWPLSPLCFL